MNLKALAIAEKNTWKREYIHLDLDFKIYLEMRGYPPDVVRILITLS